MSFNVMVRRWQKVCISIGVVVLIGGTMTGVALRHANDSLLSPVMKSVDRDRSVLGQLKPYPIFAYREIHVKDIPPEKVEAMLAPILTKRGYIAAPYPANYMTGKGWTKRTSATNVDSIDFWDGTEQGIGNGTIICTCRNANLLESTYARVAKLDLPDDPLGDGTIADFLLK